MTKTGAVANAYTNGVQVSSFPTTQSSSLTTNAKRVAVGNAISIATRWWGGSFGGALLFNRALTLSEIQKVEASILWQRAWHGLLPANHPFRNRPPLIGD
jgi:hypothetical protein